VCVYVTEVSRRSAGAAERLTKLQRCRARETSVCDNAQTLVVPKKLVMLQKLMIPLETVMTSPLAIHQTALGLQTMVVEQPLTMRRLTRQMGFQEKASW
jgi:hypothetical protein